MARQGICAAAQVYSAAKAITGEEVRLSAQERKCVLDASVAEIDKLSLIPAALSVSGEHCHLLAKFGALKIRPTIAAIKGEATKALRAAGFPPERVWSRECHPKSKKDGRDFQIAFKYVIDHVNEGAEVHIWPNFREIVNQL